MTHDSHSLLEPPRWTHAVLRFALPCDSTRAAILGDLHEELAHDVAEVGVRRARLRHLSRTTGITARALFDSAICQGWVSTHDGASGRAAMSSAANAAHGGSPPMVLRRARAVLGAVGFPLLALVVVVVGVVVNTTMFSAAAAQPESARASSAAGIGGVALLIAFVAIAAIVLCVGPRLRRKRLRGA